MCQLFALSSAQPVWANDLLREFFSHADENPHGWGFADLAQATPAVLHGQDAAHTSPGVRLLLGCPLALTAALAHIRFATVGQVDLANCHPFSGADASGRRWTLMHKGTVFSFEPLSPYFRSQQGSTDSERILLYLLDAVNAMQELKGAPLEADERFAVFDGVSSRIAPGNCLTLAVYDSDQLYIYSNYSGGLQRLDLPTGVLFSTAPLATARSLRYIDAPAASSMGEDLAGTSPDFSRSGAEAPGQASEAAAAWQPLALCTAMAFKHGRQTAEGQARDARYTDNADDTRYLYLDAAAL